MSARSQVPHYKSAAQMLDWLLLIENLISIPNAIYKGIFFSDASSHQIAALIGLITIFTLVVWDKFKLRRLNLLPGVLIAVVVATAITATFDTGVTYLLTENLQLDAGVNIGITQGADDFNPFVGFAVRF